MLDDLRPHLGAAGWDGKGRPDLLTIEKALTYAGIPWDRWLDWSPPQPWVFAVEGVPVALAQSVGELEAKVWEWVSRETPEGI